MSGINGGYIFEDYLVNSKTKFILIYHRKFILIYHRNLYLYKQLYTIMRVLYLEKGNI